MRRFTSCGKLLLTAEYSVLQGAEAIAVPTILGQSLSLEENAAPCFLRWQAHDNHHQLWLIADFDKDFNVENASENRKAEFLAELLKHAFSGTESIAPGTLIDTKLEFNRQWGLGSSSTLVHLVAQLANCDPMSLFFKAFKGSGYDVAVAMENAAIKYQLKDKSPSWEKVTVPTVFKQTQLVYLQQKQDSQSEVNRFENKRLPEETIGEITDLSRALLEVNTLEELAEIMDDHEKLTAEFLQRSTIKESLFPDFNGSIKSLGAWGGDFIWVIPDPLQADYFHKKGFDTQLNFGQLVL